MFETSTNDRISKLCHFNLVLPINVIIKPQWVKGTKCKWQFFKNHFIQNHWILYTLKEQEVTTVKFYLKEK